MMKQQCKPKMKCKLFKVCKREYTEVKQVACKPKEPCPAPPPPPPPPPPQSQCCNQPAILFNT